MKLIYNVQIRYGRIAWPETAEKLSFEFDARKTLVPYIYGLRDRKLSCYIHSFLAEQAVRRVKDLKPFGRAFLQWARWLEKNGINAFVPDVMRYKSPSYGFREYLICMIEQHHISSATAAGYINAIRRFYEFLAQHHVLDLDGFLTSAEKYVDGGRKVVSSDLTIRMVRTDRRSLNPLNAEEQRVLAEVIHHEPEQFRLMISLMKNSGLRLDEMLTLPASMFREEVLAGSQSGSEIVRGIHIGPGCGVHTKFSMTRELFITRGLYSQVLDYLLSTDYEKKIIKWRAQEGEENYPQPLFVMTNGRRMSENAFYSRWYVFRKRFDGAMGGQKCRHKPHDLRATFATEFLRTALAHFPEQAANALGTVKYWMGHKSENTTMKYIVFLQQNQISDAVAGVMDAFISDAVIYGGAPDVDG